jgi:hypothetical protein
VRAAYNITCDCGQISNSSIVLQWNLAVACLNREGKKHVSELMNSTGILSCSEPKK